MEDDTIVECINGDLSALIDRFMLNTREDLAKMRWAFDQGDMEELQRLGHTIKGTGYGYGFRGMGDLGKLLEEDVKSGDINGVGARIDAFANYLDRVVVEFEDEPM